MIYLSSAKQKTYDVFLSHSHADAGWVGELAKKLEKGMALPRGHAEDTVNRGTSSNIPSIRMAVLQSAPLVYYDKTGQARPVGALEFDTEREHLFKSFRDAKRAIEIRIEAATAGNLQKLVLLGYRALHYSGHGHPEFLVFEDERGAVYKLLPDTIRQLTTAGGSHGIELVFVSACHSRTAAEAFTAAGVPHVVGVRLETPVYDIAARTFAYAFYLALSAGKTVRQAYDSGKAALTALQDPLSCDAKKFILLPENGDHDAAIFSDIPVGEFRDITEKIPDNLTLPAVHVKFTGRNVDMQEVISEILDNRFVTVLGAPGIGKTALSIAAAHYMNERRLFSDGIFFVRLQNKISAEAVRAAISFAMDIPAKNDEELFRELRKRRCLIVLDNCEDVLHHAPGEFKKFLTGLLDARDIKLLLTSRQPGGIAIEKTKKLHRLTDMDAARLFMGLCSQPLYVELGTKDYDETIRKLAGHPVLKFLSGHPHAIALAVPLLHEKSLWQLEQILRSEKEKALKDQDIDEDDLDAITSLTVSLGVSINYVREKDPDAIRLFAVMGLLPSGALSSDLDAIWGDGWHQLMDKLVRFCLVERGDFGNFEHFFTFPFITSCAERLLTDNDRIIFERRACEYYSKMSEDISRMMGTQQASAAHLLMALEGENFMACLLRKPQAQEGTEMSPSAVIAFSLPRNLLFVYRTDDGKRAAEKGIEVCRLLNDKKSEANTLKALGDLKVRVSDLDGARRDYETALPIYRDIKARLGEANTLQSLGNLLAAEGKFDEAFPEFQKALEIHIKVQNLLGVGAVLGYSGRAKIRAAQFKQAAMLFEAALFVHTAVGDKYGQALDLMSQADAFNALSAPAGTLAAWWQARQIFRAIQSPAAEQLDELFSQLEKNVGAEIFQKITSDLDEHADEERHAALLAVQKDAMDDAFMQEVMKVVSLIMDVRKEKEQSG